MFDFAKELYLKYIQRFTCSKEDRIYINIMSNIAYLNSTKSLNKKSIMKLYRTFLRDLQYYSRRGYDSLSLGIEEEYSQYHTSKVSHYELIILFRYISRKFSNKFFIDFGYCGSEKRLYINRMDISFSKNKKRSKKITYLYKHGGYIILSTK